MTPDLQVISPDASPEQALDCMTKGNFRHIPVVDEAGKVLGAISQRDLIGAAER
jgi:CBS domain-containing protein